MLLGLSVLKVILAEDDLEAFSKLQERWFLDKEERKIYKKVIKYLERYGKLPPASFVEGDADAHPTDFYVDEIKKRYQSFKLQRLIDIMQAQEDPAETINYIQEFLLREEDMQTTEIYTGDSIVELIISDIQIARERGAATGMVGLPTGWATLDSVTGGYMQGDIIVFVGRPKTGKTMYMIHSLSNLLSRRYKAMFISMEMTKQQILRRLTALRGRFNTSVFKTGEITTPVEEIAQEVVNDIKDSLIIIEGQLTKTFSELIGVIKLHKPDVVFIDGAYLMGNSRSFSSLWEEITSTVKNIKRVAITSNIPIVCSFQFTKKAVGRGDNLGLEYIHLSDAIGQIASYVIGIIDADVPYQKKLMIIGARDSDRDDFFVNWDWQRMDFSEITEEGGVLYENFNEVPDEEINTVIEDNIDD
jgi:replicative DNA helicase